MTHVKSVIVAALLSTLAVASFAQTPHHKVHHHHHVKHPHHHVGK